MSNLKETGNSQVQVEHYGNLDPDGTILTGAGNNPKQKKPAKKTTMIFKPKLNDGITSEAQQMVTFIRSQEDAASFLAWKVFSENQHKEINYSNNLHLHLMKGDYINGKYSVEIFINGVYYITEAGKPYTNEIPTEGDKIRLINKLEESVQLCVRNNYSSLLQATLSPNEEHLFALDFVLCWGRLKEGTTVTQGEYLTVLDLELLGNGKYYSELPFIEAGKTNYQVEFNYDENVFTFNS